MNIFERKKHNMSRVFELASKGLNTSAAIAKDMGLPQDSIQKYLAEMDKQGAMFRATISTRETYWFTTQQEANKCLERHKETKKEAPLVSVVGIKHVRFADDAEVIRPKGLKVQQCPGYRGDRFAHTEAVVGGFRTLGVGRYLESDEAMLRRIARKGA